MLCFIIIGRQVGHAQLYAIKPTHTFKINATQLFTRELWISYEQGNEHRNASEFSIAYRVPMRNLKYHIHEQYVPLISADRFSALVPAASGFMGSYQWRHYSKTRKPQVDYFLSVVVLARYIFYNDEVIYYPSKVQMQSRSYHQSLDQYQWGFKFLTGKRYYHFRPYKNVGWSYEIYGGVGFRFQHQFKTIYKLYLANGEIHTYDQPIFERRFTFLPTAHFGIALGMVSGKQNTGN